jgi:hypothetical protein
VRPWIVLAVAALSVGCAATRWARPGGSEADRQQDERECAAAADRERAVPERRVVSASSRRGVDETIELVPRREFDVAAFDACMRDRGYRRVPVPPR